MRINIFLFTITAFCILVTMNTVSFFAGVVTSEHRSCEADNPAPRWVVYSGMRISSKMGCWLGETIE